MPRPEFRIFDEKLPCCQKVKVYFTLLLLTLIGGFLEKLGYARQLEHQRLLTLTVLTPSASSRRRLGGLWPFSLILPWYMYTVALDNMMFGGSKPTFAEEFTWCNYIIKYYTIGCCGLCGFPVKVWVDRCIAMGEPKFDEEMARQDAQADAANPKELSRRFSNQSASGPPSLLDPTRSVSFVTAEEQNSSNDVEQGGRARGSEAGIEIAMVQAPASAPPLTTVHSSIFRKRAEEEARRAAEAKTEADAAAEAPKVAKTEAGAADGADGADTQGPQSLREFLAACGLEHRAQNFEDEEYTLEDLLSAFKSGAAKGDLRDLKLTLGECRKILSHLEATAA